ncbi:MAG: hypothetical protein JWO22_1272 [Frankiales bacterium]|nr:hypothetical protein [Frankiales bacterium]
MTTTTGPRRPPGRYDEPRSLPRPVLIGGAVVLLTALVAFSFVAFQHYSGSRARFSNLDYTVESETSVLIRFQISLGAGDRAQCLLQARDRDNAEVGSRTVTVAGEDTSMFTVEEHVTTTRRAVAGEVLSCRRS